MRGTELQRKSISIKQTGSRKPVLRWCIDVFVGVAQGRVMRLSWRMYRRSVLKRTPLASRDPMVLQIKEVNPFSTDLSRQLDDQARPSNSQCTVLS